MNPFAELGDTPAHTVFVATEVRKDWLTDSYEVRYRVMADVAGTMHELSTGAETFGPLWGVDQVERLVSLMCDRLRELDWSRAVRDALEVETAPGGS